MLVSARRKPVQGRSQETVEIILTATTQVLAERGYAGASTNYVAKVAGVSIGSLYQYFSSKDDLIRAVIERHAQEILSLLRETVSNLDEVSIPVAVRSFVKGMVEAHAVDPALHRVCVEQAFHLGLDHIIEIRGAAVALVEMYLEPFRDQMLPKDLSLAAYVIVTTVDTVIHGAMLNPETPDMDALGEEVVAIVLRYLGIKDADAQNGVG